MSTTETERSFGWQTLESLPKATPLYCVLRHVSASGMSRSIDVYAIINNQPRFIGVPESGYATKDGKAQQRNHGAYYKAGGAGMDMGAALVYDLGATVHGDGYYFKAEWL